jgi:hypothetical protein
MQCQAPLKYEQSVMRLSASPVNDEIFYGNMDKPVSLGDSLACVSPCFRGINVNMPAY